MAQYCFIAQVIIIPLKISFVVKVLIVSNVIVWNITDVRYDFVRNSLTSYKHFVTVFNFVQCVETFTSNHTLQISIKLSGLSIVFNEPSCLTKKMLIIIGFHYCNIKYVRLYGWSIRKRLIYLWPWAGDESMRVGVKDPIKDPMESSM